MAFNQSTQQATQPYTRIDNGNQSPDAIQTYRHEDSGMTFHAKLTAEPNRWGERDVEFYSDAHANHTITADQVVQRTLVNEYSTDQNAFRNSADPVLQELYVAHASRAVLNENTSPTEAAQYAYAQSSSGVHSYEHAETGKYLHITSDGQFLNQQREQVQPAEAIAYASGKSNTPPVAVYEQEQNQGWGL